MNNTHTKAQGMFSFAKYTVCMMYFVISAEHWPLTVIMNDVLYTYFKSPGEKALREGAERVKLNIPEPILVFDTDSKWLFLLFSKV